MEEGDLTVMAAAASSEPRRTRYENQYSQTRGKVDALY